MWEYDRVEIKTPTIAGIINEMNVLGANGWEIINYNESTPKKLGDNWICIVILKRLK